jgi:Protein of unknown function (DUF3570)
VAATRAAIGLWRRLLGLLGSLLGGLFAAAPGRAADLPPDRADAMVHLYSGGGVDAYGPAILLRKKVFDKVSLSGSYYMDAVSNASIDVVTTASKYHEIRHEFGLGADYVYRDTQITVGLTTSHEPDYTANAGNLDFTQEVFAGMTSISLGFTRGADTVLKTGSPEFHDKASHWQYRLGATQILSPRWLVSANFEALSDDGYLGSPYRVARAFGTTVPERNPRTRTGRALKFRLVGDLGSRDSMYVGYRYFTDTWDIKAHTAELGYSRYFGDDWLLDTYLRYYTQTHALFYSDNATTETLYLSRNRQLSTYNDESVGAKLAYGLRHVPGSYDLKLNGALEYTRFKFKDFTDVRTGELYGYSAVIFQVFLSATY